MALARYQAFAQDAAGNILAASSVTVTNENTAALAVLYSDRLGTAPIANPFAADSEGFYFFHVVGGSYRIDVTKNGFTRTFRYVGIGTASEIDVGASGQQGRRITDAGDVTISATTDDRVYVAKTIPAATNVNFPSVAARVASGGAPIFLKNEHANPALYSLQPVLSGTDTMEGTATPLPQDSRAGVWYWPDNQVTPHNWEIR